MIRRAGFILFTVCAVLLYSDEGISNRERENLLEAFPQTEADRLQIRKTDTVIRKDGEHIACTVLRFDEQRVSIRHEGLKIDIPRDQIERILLAQDILQVFDYRLKALGKEEFDKKYGLAVEALGRAEEDRRFIKWASRVLQHCAERGKHVPSIIKQGNILEEQGKYSVAALKYKRAVDLSEGEFVSILHYAGILRKQRFYFESEQWYRKALALKADDLESLEGLAFCLLKQDRFGQAKKYYDQLFAAEPSYGPALAGYGLLLGYRGKYFQSLAYCSKALSREDPSMEAYKLKGMLEYEFGFYDSAMKYFNRAQAFEDPFEMQELDTCISVIRTIQGSFSANDTLFSKYTTEEILSKPDVGNAIGFYHLKRGMRYEKEKNTAQSLKEYAQAEKAFIKGSGNFDKNYYGKYGLGITYLRLGKGREGAQFLNRAYQARKDFFLPVIALAQYYLRQKDYSSAVREYKRIREPLEEKYRTYSGLGKAADSRLRTYADVYRKRTEKELISLYTGMLRSLIMLNRLQEASVCAVRFKDILPGSSAVFDFLGYLAFVSGRKEEAGRFFKTGKDMGSTYSKGKYSRMLIARNQREYLDDFNRTDSSDVRNNWLEKERAGVNISISGNRLLFDGTVSRAWSISTCSKSFPSSSFVSLNTDMLFEKGASAFFSGIFIMGQKSGKGIFLVSNDKGKICFSSSDLQNEHDGWKWFSIGDRPSGNIMSLGIRQIDRNNRKFKLTVNGRAVKTLLSGSLVKEEYFRIGCMTQADRGTRIRVGFDDLRVITEKR